MLAVIGVSIGHGEHLNAAKSFLLSLASNVRWRMSEGERSSIECA